MAEGQTDSQRATAARELAGMRGGLSADDCARIRAMQWGDRTGRHQDPSVRRFHPSTTRAVRTRRAGLTRITTAEKLQRRTMRASNVYSRLIKTLVKAGIIRERTRMSFVSGST